MRYAAILAIFVYPSLALFGQTAVSPSAAPVADPFSRTTAQECHGAQAEGSDRAPRLSGDRRVRAQSVDQLQNQIHTGIAAAGMPGFNLPPEQLTAAAQFVHSLNSGAADVAVPGDINEGRKFCFELGNARLVTFLWPRLADSDLSNVGRELSEEDIREPCSIPRNGLRRLSVIDLKLRNGKPSGGSPENSRISRLSWRIQGKVHLLQRREIVSASESSQAMMPRTKAHSRALLFFADPNGTFAVADARNSNLLWHFAMNTSMKASPMTYLAGNKQFVAIAAGPMIICFGLKQESVDSRSP